MTEVYPHLFIGTVEELPKLSTDEWRIVNVAKTQHLTYLHWSKPIPNHPHYIFYETPHLISVNWVDGPAHLYDYQGQGVSNCKRIMEFIDRNIIDYNIFIACNQGYSRSPSIALLYLAKYAQAISHESFQKAKEDFLKLYPSYDPGGIADFLEARWHDL